MSSDRIAPEDEMAFAASLPQADASSLVDREVLEAQVQDMYRQVAREEEEQLHFAVGRQLALRLDTQPSSSTRYPPRPWRPSPASATTWTSPRSHRRQSARPRSGLRNRCFLRRSPGRRRRKGGRSRLHRRASRQGDQAEEIATGSHRSSSSRRASTVSPSRTPLSTSSSRTGSSTSRPSRTGSSPRRHASFGPADDSRSPTSSAARR